jgi:nucleoside phosphorylase
MRTTTGIRRGTASAAASALALAIALTASVAGCGSDDNDLEEPFLAVLGAFPAELGALVERAQVDETVEIEGRVLRLGRLGGVRVVLGMTGIGLVNADQTTRLVLDHYAVTGVVMSGVAGAPLRIGDVAVPEAWEFGNPAPGEEARYECDEDWYALAGRVVARNLDLDDCTVVPASGQAVCLEHEPAVFLGGTGESADPFGGRPVVCGGSDDVFGCDITTGAPEAVAARDDGQFEGPHVLEPAAVDMETTAVARVAAERGLPFIAFRSVSDGAGDPLNLPGFPSQFFAYYRLAASTAAAAATAFLEEIAASHGD